MLFLTYNDSPSGIYFSQVTDVCHFLNVRLNAKIKLVALISVRNFWENRRKIKSQISSSLIIPMIPGIGNWKFNFYLLWLLFVFIDSKKIIARGPFAASLALRLRKSGMVKFVCFDARGASVAETDEYNVWSDKKNIKTIFETEKNAIINSDYRMAVSNSLVNYWIQEFGYKENKHVTIPCTLNSNYFKKLPAENFIKTKRSQFGFSENDTILVFSGSLAGWQSFQLIDDFLFEQMKQNSSIKIFLLLKKFPSNMKIAIEFSNRISCKWFNEHEVPDILSICDYGLLLREKSITNKVASPVKFAEYLASGLKIIISDGVGDYSAFVRKHECGFILNQMNLNLIPLSYSEKLKNSLLAFQYLSKESLKEKYQRIIE